MSDSGGERVERPHREEHPDVDVGAGGEPASRGLAPNAGLTGSSFRPGRRQRAAAGLRAAPGLLTGESLAGVSPARGPSRASERGLSALQDLKYSLADTLPIPGETAASESQFPR